MMGGFRYFDSDSDSFSSSDSSADGDREDWFMQRRRIRQALLQGHAVTAPEATQRKFKPRKR